MNKKRSVDLDGEHTNNIMLNITQYLQQISQHYAKHKTAFRDR